MSTWKRPMEEPQPEPRKPPGRIPPSELFEPPLLGLAENEMTPLDQELLRSLVESVDLAVRQARRRRSGTPSLALAPPEEHLAAFLEIWSGLKGELGLELEPEDALAAMADLTVYDIPDGTRSTLTVPPEMDVEVDAGMYCVGFVHAMRSLGARRCVMMTHTAYNRQRGPEDEKRFLRVLARGVEPMTAYARRHGVALHVVGAGPAYELEPILAAAIPAVERPSLDAWFLVDYAEEMVLRPEGQQEIARLPEVDVCVRHTKLQVSGGWIPTKMLRSTYVYCQNGALFSNWTHEEYVGMAACCLLSKVLMSGEVLSKSYTDIDEIKRRYQMRELNLFQKVVKLREKPRKLFVVGSPVGLYQIYY